jgi:hypothetical protein
LVEADELDERYKALAVVPVAPNLIQDSGFRIQDSGFRNDDLGFMCKVFQVAKKSSRRKPKPQTIKNA